MIAVGEIGVISSHSLKPETYLRFAYICARASVFMHMTEGKYHISVLHFIDEILNQMIYIKL